MLISNSFMPTYRMSLKKAIAENLCDFFKIRINFSVFDTHNDFLQNIFGSYWHFLQTFNANAKKLHFQKTI
jgi:hypothetical protein